MTILLFQSFGNTLAVEKLQCRCFLACNIVRRLDYRHYFLYDACIPPFHAGAVPLTGSEVVDGNGLIILGNLHCAGNESRLINCPHNGFLKHDCSHSGDAGVKCSPSSSKSRSFYINNNISQTPLFFFNPCPC